MNLDDLLT